MTAFAKTRARALLQGALGLLAAIAVLCSPTTARAVDVWTTPNPGIRHLHRTTPAPAEFHVLVVDLNAPGVSIRCTPIDERWRSTSQFARQSTPPLAAAMNGGFWGLFGQGAQGLAAGNGRVWSSDDEELGFFAFGRDGRAWISRPSDVVEAGRRGVTDGVSGRPLLVDRSRVSDELAAFTRTYSREPRSAVGVSLDGRTVYMVTVDGRRSTSQGGTLMEMAELMIELGAYRGINLDGGGSTTMYVATEGGVVNRPSRGWEREVVNHIGVIAPAPAPSAPPPQATQTVQETPSAVVQRALESRANAGNTRTGDADVEAGEGTGARGWLRARLGGLLMVERLGLGKHREVVVPLFFLAAVGILFGTAFVVVRRVVRRRAKAS